jgi:hypothetical protein
MRTISLRALARNPPELERVLVTHRGVVIGTFEPARAQAYELLQRMRAQLEQPMWPEERVESASFVLRPTLLGRLRTRFGR